MSGINGDNFRFHRISPGAQAEDRSTEAKPRTAEELGRGAQAAGPSVCFEATGGVRMTKASPALPLSEPIRSALKKKRVLLVDTSPTKRDLRAEVMRKLGMKVDCAADTSEARSWWRADLYNLVLINVEDELDHRDKFCEDMRSATPRQQLAFLC
jgi:PleD family two-component response regulator